MTGNRAQIFQRVHDATVQINPTNRQNELRLLSCDFAMMLVGSTPNSLRSHLVAVKLADDLNLQPIGRDGRALSEWLTTFHMATVVLDPYTNESSWILKSAVRLLEELRGCHARVNLLLTSDEADTRQFLGPIADQFLTFIDPDRTVVKALGISAIPAFAFIRVDGSVDAIAEGWNPAEWRKVAEAITAATAWKTPTIPLPGDPVAFAGSPALG